MRCTYMEWMIGIDSLFTLGSRQNGDCRFNFEDLANLIAELRILSEFCGDNHPRGLQLPLRIAHSIRSVSRCVGGG